jgi:NADPH:quinone reductase-like Zn-dependent oxidoreductase
MLYPDSADYDLMASSFINPLTVCYFWHLLKQQGTKAIVQDAANSSLGKMFINLCKANDIQTINIVRKEEQVKQLQDFGAEHVLNSSDEDYEHNLERLVSELKPQAFFD